jgi:hypothetical protein
MMKIKLHLAFAEFHIGLPKVDSVESVALCGAILFMNPLENRLLDLTPELFNNRNRGGSHEEHDHNTLGGSSDSHCGNH